MTSMVIAMTKRRELNPEERADAIRLKACFEKLQEERRASGLPDSQEAIASEYDWTQSTISSGDVDLVLVGVAVESRSSLLSAMGR